MTEFLEENEMLYRIYTSKQRFNCSIKNGDYSNLIDIIKEELEKLTIDRNKIEIVRIG